MLQTLMAFLLLMRPFMMNQVGCGSIVFIGIAQMIFKWFKIDYLNHFV